MVHVVYFGRVAEINISHVLLMTLPFDRVRVPKPPLHPRTSPNRMPSKRSRSRSASDSSGGDVASAQGGEEGDLAILMDVSRMTSFVSGDGFDVVGWQCARARSSACVPTGALHLSLKSVGEAVHVAVSSGLIRAFVSSCCFCFV
jgi:hypothetical protein